MIGEVTDGQKTDRQTTYGGNRGAHSTDKWKQAASWKKFGEVKLGEFFT